MLKRQYESIQIEIDRAVMDVLKSGEYILGKEVTLFEHEITDYFDINHAIGVASGSDALYLSLLACDIQPDDEIITTPFTFIATTEAITRCGAKPIFVDIDPQTFNIDTTKIEKAITPSTKAIIPVHLYGKPCHMNYIKSLAKKYNLIIIEDCAQSFGATYNGKKVGTIGDVGCLSFFPTKILGTYGDGGMVITNNGHIAIKIRQMRTHGSTGIIYENEGINSRLDELQAAILRTKLYYVDQWIIKRQHIAGMYIYADIGHSGHDKCHVYNHYTIRTNNRTKIIMGLGEEGYEARIYYTLPLHLQPVYKYLGYKEGDFPEAEKASEEVLSIPIYPEMTLDDILNIIYIIKEVEKK